MRTFHAPIRLGKPDTQCIHLKTPLRADFAIGIDTWSCFFLPVGLQDDIFKTTLTKKGQTIHLRLSDANKDRFPDR